MRSAILLLALAGCSTLGPFDRSAEPPKGISAAQEYEYRQSLIQKGTGQDIPPAKRIPDAPQYRHPGGPVGNPVPRPRPTTQEIFKSPCISRECRTFCRPDNLSAPKWCMQMLPPADGYLDYPNERE